MRTKTLLRRAATVVHEMRNLTDASSSARELRSLLSDLNHAIGELKTVARDDEIVREAELLRRTVRASLARIVPPPRRRRRHSPSLGSPVAAAVSSADAAAY